VFTVLPPHDRQAAQIKGNSVGLDGRLRRRGGESKVNVMGGPTAMTTDSAVIAVGPPHYGHLMLLTEHPNIGYILRDRS